MEPRTRSDDTVFDNTVWHALTGPQRTVAERHGGAVRFPIEVSPFCAFADAPSSEDWDALHELVGPGGQATLFRTRTSVPAAWEVLVRMPCVQMVAERVEGTPFAGAVQLGPADVDEMLGLVRDTEPGPFGMRTVELGTYLGVRDRRSLVAMAGERLHCEGWQEISAVCTSPSHRGRGLAAALVRTLVAAIHARGERAFLQSRSDNHGAIRLYESLGFRIAGSGTVEAVILRAPS